MPEYIERESLLAYKYDSNWNAPISYLPPEYVVDVRDILDAPAADVEPVRHGYWFLRGGSFHCSVCDGKALWNCGGGTGGWSREYTQAKSERCPRCGARMDLECVSE